MSALIGVTAFIFVLLNTLFWCIFLLSFAVLKLLLPIESWKIFFTKLIIFIGECWIFCNKAWINLLHKPKWKVNGFQKLDSKNWYLVTANHQSWADIFVLQSITNRNIPMLKFFMKDVLKWVPIIGLAWWALDMPFLKRYTKDQLEKNPKLRGRDIEQMKKSFGRYSRYPVSIFSFAEGTRFTEDKKLKQKSPYQKLLLPKTGGIALALSTMPYIKSFINFTIKYDSEHRTFWKFLCGKMNDVTVEVEIIEIPESFFGNDYLNDESFRQEIKGWLNQIWLKKDKLLIK
ncbi:MAG: acyltransferase [Gammaproteobacteria bacterium]|nr:acyltransferase [Pseudomonadota bacterium]GIS33294.1 MAG: acyltransferase [Gammaproteobacteria bacterium]